MTVRFVESDKFPIDSVNRASEKEKSGGGRPDYWEMVFWWTRKPLASARALIAGALLPAETISKSEFERRLRLDQPVPHRKNPELGDWWEQYFKGKSLLDPFAGFGSIPLEAMRLGLSRVVAVELIPVAYVFLKAVLEYPARYGKKLVEDVRRWGNWITEQLKKDSLIRELYDDDVAVYIGTWEIKCPHCGKWTPLVGNWWLARVYRTEKGKRRYVAVSFMRPVIRGDKVDIEVIDVIKAKKAAILPEVSIQGNKIIVKTDKNNTREYEVPNPNISTRKETATCLHCRNDIRFVDPETGRHYIEKAKAPASVRKRLIWYVKYALTRYNQGDEEFARLRLLVKVKKVGSELVFESCTEEDQEKLRKAKEEFEKLLASGDPDIPTEPISPYSSRYLFPILYGMTEWYKLFNPRQLLVLTKIVKLIREVGKRVGEREDCAEAITTFLAIMLCKRAQANSLVNYWLPTMWSKAKIAPTLAARGISMQWNWVEVNPVLDFPMSWIGCVKLIINSLSYLLSSLSKGSRSITVLFDDATTLNKLSPDCRFDIVITDPPYYDDVPYTELSDFYYVWLPSQTSL